MKKVFLIIGMIFSLSNECFADGILPPRTSLSDYLYIRCGATESLYNNYCGKLNPLVIILPIIVVIVVTSIILLIKSKKKNDNGNDNFSNDNTFDDDTSDDSGSDSD